MVVLVTGGAGYIGSHTCIELLASGFELVVVDNFCNSKPVALERVQAISAKPVPYYRVDVTDREALREVFRQHRIGAVLHFAGLKAVGESCEVPLTYYHNNVNGSMILCQVMEEFGVNRLIFSSSATIYGDPDTVPVREDFPPRPASPYGRSKLMVEDILRDLCATPGNPWQVGVLRYFNPIGAHESGQIGEDPRGIPNNLLPYVAQVALGKLDCLQVFGDDYPTPDGTGVRDYIHVVDLACGHVKMLQKLLQAQPGCYTYNLGTGRGYSVLEVVKAFEKASGRAVRYRVAARRPGDVAKYYADPALAACELDWCAEFGLERMAADTWRWQSRNPDGYGN